MARLWGSRDKPRGMEDARRGVRVRREACLFADCPSPLFPPVLLTPWKVVRVSLIETGPNRIGPRAHGAGQRHGAWHCLGKQTQRKRMRFPVATLWASSSIFFSRRLLASGLEALGTQKRAGPSRSAATARGSSSLATQANAAQTVDQEAPGPRARLGTGFLKGHSRVVRPRPPDGAARLQSHLRPRWNLFRRKRRRRCRHGRRIPQWVEQRPQGQGVLGISRNFLVGAVARIPPEREGPRYLPRRAPTESIFPP
jgi:hypothetical protein